MGERSLRCPYCDSYSTYVVRTDADGRVGVCQCGHCSKQWMESLPFELAHDVSFVPPPKRCPRCAAKRSFTMVGSAFLAWRCGRCAYELAARPERRFIPDRRMGPAERRSLNDRRR
jgi:ribosomal protein L37AE/L43A